VFGSATQPPAVDRDLVDHVVSELGLSIKSQKNTRHNRRSRNVILDTSDGRVVLKRYRPEWGPETVECVHSTLERLEEIDEPGPRPLATPSGHSWLYAEESVLAVFRFIKGNSYATTFLARRDRLDITSRTASALARLHTSLVDFAPGGSHHHGLDQATGRPKRDMRWHVSMVDELKSRSAEIQDPAERALADQMDHESPSLLETLDGLDSILNQIELPTTVIHGDFGIHNLIFPKGTAPVPIDFELSRRDWRLNDLISATGKHRFKDGSYDLESMKVFVASYDRRFPLTAGERRLLAEAWAHYKLRAAVQYWNSYHVTSGPIRKLRSAIDSLAQARQVLEDPGPVRALAER
jgi:Ser/Thr protein kinase RdoA (MazF antagonist)